MTDNKKTIIVDSMSIEDIMKLLMDDKSFFNHKRENVGKPFKKKVKMLPNRKEEYFFEPVEFKSAKGFNYVFQYFKRGSDDYKKEQLGLIIYVWFVKNRGIYVIQESLLHRQYVHYSIIIPHFFSRYRERFLKDLSIQTKDVINIFYRRNYRFAATGLPSEKYPEGYWMFCKDGLLLCRRLEGLTIEIKTFVPWEMTRQDQHIKILEDLQATKEMGWNTDFEKYLPDEILDEYLNESMD